MFGNKALHEVEYDDLMAFLAESRDEGVRLDYKEEWTPKIAGTVCAFANTYGGYILYGVKEVAQKNRPNQPDPHDVPGVDFSKADPAASLRSKILDNTRPAVPLEIKPVPLPGSKDRGVLIVYVEESVDAPHEILIPGATRIPVRRMDTTVPASLDEIEQLIERRESLRQASAGPFHLEFFGYRFAGWRDSYGELRMPPEVAVAVRPRRINSLRFAFDSRLDQKLKHLALRSGIADSLKVKPMPSGLILEDSQDGPVTVRLEVLRNGIIRSGRALTQTSTGSPPEDFGRTRPEDPLQHWLDFGEIISSVDTMVRFCAAAFAVERSEVELEILFGMDNCQGDFTQIPGKGCSRSHTGQIPSSSFYQRAMPQNVVVNASTSKGKVDGEDMLELIREISRLFSISAPDDLLRRYIN